MEDVQLTTKAILWQEKKREKKNRANDLHGVVSYGNCQQFGGKFTVLSYVRAKCDLFSTSE